VLEITASQTPLAPLEVDLQLGEFRLIGKLERLWPQCLLHYRCSKMKMKDQMRSWIEHLVLNTVTEPGYPSATSLIMSNDVKNYTAPVSAASHLENLLNRYWQGLSMPLRFFPRSSLAYVRKESLEDAQQEWKDNTFNNSPGEGSEPAIRRCFGSEDPFDIEFCSLAIELLKPMIQSTS
jgi:exodeoxyribonuclease V gamma subunit